MVLNQEPDLLLEIGVKQIRSRHGRLVHARPRDKAVGEARVGPRMGRYRDAHKGISGAHARAERLAINISFEVIAQKASIALVDLVEAGDRRSGIGEGFGGDARWG